MCANSPSPHASPVDRVDGGERVDELLERAWLLVGLRRPRLGDAAAHGDAVDAGHHVERAAEHVGVVAREHRARDAHRLVLDRVEEAELAQHVVRGGRAAVRWRLPQHPTVGARGSRRTRRTTRRRPSARPRGRPSHPAGRRGTRAGERLGGRRLTRHAPRRPARRPRRGARSRSRHRRPTRRGGRR